MDEPANSSTVAGWREWVSLPDLGVEWIKAKLDTGARTSAIHAFDIEEIHTDGMPQVRFSVRPWQRADDDVVTTTAPLLDRRVVRSSNGQAEERLTIPLTIRVLGRDIDSHVTLSNRDEMGFRLLIGREALRQGILVDSDRSYVGGRPRVATRRRNWGR